MRVQNSDTEPLQLSIVTEIWQQGIEVGIPKCDGEFAVLFTKLLQNQAHPPKDPELTVTNPRNSRASAKFSIDPALICGAGAARETGRDCRWQKIAVVEACVMLNSIEFSTSWPVSGFAEVWAKSLLSSTKSKHDDEDHRKSLVDVILIVAALRGHVHFSAFGNTTAHHSEGETRTHAQKDVCFELTCAV